MTIYVCTHQTRPGEALDRGPDLPVYSYNVSLDNLFLISISSQDIAITMSSTTMPELPRTNEGKRICQVIKVKPEALEEYKKVNRSPTFPMLLVR
jgi:hypothetical protein